MSAVICGACGEDSTTPGRCAACGYTWPPVAEGDEVALARIRREEAAEDRRAAALCTDVTELLAAYIAAVRPDLAEAGRDVERQAFCVRALRLMADSIEKNGPASTVGG